jgi:hypothetical protein
MEDVKGRIVFRSYPYRYGADMTVKSKQGLAPRYVTQTDLAVYFSVSPNTISRWRALEHDPLPCVQMPGMKQPRFDISQVQAWAERITA